MLKKSFIIILLLILPILLFSCNEPNKLPDNLGGGGTGGQTEESTILIDNLPKHVDEDNHNKYPVDLSNAVTINLNEITEKVLTITDNGVYILTGTYIGQIIVEGEAERIVLALKNALIGLDSSSTDAPITFKKHSGTRILHLVKNSENYVEDHINNLATGEGTLIQAKKSSLVINGTGTLNLLGQGEETTAIKVKNNLEIFDATINIQATDNGIKAGALLMIHNANILAKCLNDGIKTDVEASSIEEGNELTKDIFSGYLYIYNTSMTLVVKDDGLSANSYLKINNSLNHEIYINTNNGAPSTITETSSDNANGKGIRVSGISLVTETEETDLVSNYKDNYLLVILDGTFNLNCNDDAITSKGNLFIRSGTFNISSGDDAVHAEYLTKIFSCYMIIEKCYEGIEGASVEILDGNIELTSIDDGINAANSDLTSWDYNIFISGGLIKVNSEGDGIDSNGTVEITGGDIFIFGPTKNDNAALDADKGILMNGGTLIAFGPSGMIEAPSKNSTQNVIVYNLTTIVSGNSHFELLLSNDRKYIQTYVPKAYQSVVVSTPDMIDNLTFTLKCGNNSTSVTIKERITTIGKTFGGPGHNGRPRP